MRKTLLFVLLFLCVLSASAFAGSLQETIILQQQQTTGAPTITSLSPSSTATGGPSFTLTVNGTGFVNGDFVIFNSQRRTTTFVSATQLTATILAADIGSPGTAFVTVSHPFGTTSNTATFTITAALPGGTTLSFAQIAEG
ncbi:MAG TPA: IPT/TIG domain-containing protein, partial [Acidobacteriota bacterium]|nr:IPT/TIG domain-containing protein [Acidobacteriota bacterium]